MLTKKDSENLYLEFHKIGGGAANICAVLLAIAATNPEELNESGNLYIAR